MLWLWGVVLLGNLVGVAMFALAVAQHLPLSSAAVERALFALGTATMGYTVLKMFVKAVVPAGSSPRWCG